MKRINLRLVALVTVCALLLSGCGVLDFAGYFKRLAGLFGPVAFENMEYTRPELSQLDEVLDNCLNSAADGDDLNELVGHITTLNSIFNDFQTNYLLAYIHYSIDLTDTYWETEYNYCAGHSSSVQAAADRLMYALADSELRDELEAEEYFGAGYFDEYDGESLWTEAFTALMEQETALINKYYELSSQALAVEMYSEVYYSVYGKQMEDVFVQLIKLRQQIAAEAGFDSYAEFAYDFYYSRDYTPAQTTAYLGDIRTELVPLYTKLDDLDVWEEGNRSCSEAQTYQYVEKMAAAMGGQIDDAFRQMDSSGLYHISYGENKYNASFEVFLPNYMAPFVFMNPTMTSRDKLTFAHEFGHFCNDYASGGTTVGIDVAEFFSQGMEYLSLCYVDGASALVGLKMADSLCVYVEQAAFADFEEQVYRLSAQELTMENIRTLYGKTTDAYGFGEYVDDRSYVTVGHFFTSPMYVISYVVSNDAAMQLYQMEMAEEGSGLNCYTGNLATEQEGFLAFVKEAGLQSPFDPGRIQAVKDTLKKTLW